MRKEVIWSLVFGAIAGVVALTIAVVMAGGGHGSYAPAKLLFPYTMLIAGSSIGFFGMLLAIVQWPLYAASLASATPARRVSLALIVGAAHASAAFVCLATLHDW
jgi:hypothetical protein